MVMTGTYLIIGRDPSCDVVVDGVHVSPRHAAIGGDRGGVWVADLGSTNGTHVGATFVSAVHVPLGVPRTIRPDDTVWIGRTALRGVDLIRRLHEHAGPPPAAPERAAP
jgi:pSer/pThr/pTyr-binding forkhead associated (FHA) protein